MSITDWPDDIMICIPAFRSAIELSDLLPRVLSWAPGDRILVIDDGSGDETSRVCTGAGVRCRVLDRNMGKGAALAAGFEILCAQKIQWIITIDADGQHDPADLPRFIEASRENPPAGLCIGKRRMKPGTMPPDRILSNLITSRILSIMTGIRILDSQCGYRLYNTALLQRVSIEYSRFEMESEIILKAARLGFPVRFIAVQTLYLNHGSHISHIGDTFRWVRAVIKIYSGLRKDRTKDGVKQR